MGFKDELEVKMSWALLEELLLGWDWGEFIEIMFMVVICISYYVYLMVFGAYKFVTIYNN